MQWFAYQSAGDNAPWQLSAYTIGPPAQLYKRFFLLPKGVCKDPIRIVYVVCNGMAATLHAAGHHGSQACRQHLCNQWNKQDAARAEDFTQTE